MPQNVLTKATFICSAVDALHTHADARGTWAKMKSQKSKMDVRPSVTFDFSLLSSAACAWCGRRGAGAQWEPAPVDHKAGALQVNFAQFCRDETRATWSGSSTLLPSSGVRPMRR